MSKSVQGYSLQTWLEGTLGTLEGRSSSDKLLRNLRLNVQIKDLEKDELMAIVHFLDLK